MVIRLDACCQNMLSQIESLTLLLSSLTLMIEKWYSSKTTAYSLAQPHSESSESSDNENRAPVVESPATTQEDAQKIHAKTRQLQTARDVVTALKNNGEGVHRVIL